MDEIQAKLDKLKQSYTDEESREVVSTWEKALKKSRLFLDLKNHAAFKIILDSFEKELVLINKRLQDEVVLFTTPEGVIIGRLLHERKRFIKDFFKPFDYAKSTMQSVDNQITKALINEDHE